jgi:spermidine dehydrogenase
MASEVVRQEYIDGFPAHLTGLQAQTLTAAAALHAMAFKKQEYNIDSLPNEEEYDLVVAGAGVSGLSTVHFYRKQFGNDKKILIIDPLDDFGGHAKRNEFTVDGKTLIGYGGSESFQSPVTNFSPTVHSLLKDLGVDIHKFENQYFQKELYPGLGLSRASFFDQDSKFGGGKNTLVTGDPTIWVADDIPSDRLNAKPIEQFIQEFPLSQEARNELVQLWTNKEKVTLAHLKDGAAREEYLSKINYEEFLRKDWGLSEEAISYFKNRTRDFFGSSPAQVPALDAGYFGYPGTQGVKDLEPNHEAEGELNEPYIHHFPDGNSSVARLLVRSFIPQASCGTTMEDIVLAKFDYSKLDDPQNNVRIRLNCAVVKAKNVTEGCNTHVDIGYVKYRDNSSLHRIRAKHVILACYGMAIPYIVPEMSKEQSDALHLNVKAPLVYTNVAVRNWKPWVNLKVHDIYPVSSFHSRIKLDFPIVMGGYSSALTPDQPILLHLVHVPSVEGADPRAALRASRKTLFSRKFEDFENEIRKDLTRMLGPGGFDAEKDIAGITVNRWSHGYSFNPNSLSESEEAAEAYIKAGSKLIGNIRIAGSDSAWNPYLHSAIDEGFRAVSEFSETEAKK